MFEPHRAAPQLHACICCGPLREVVCFGCMTKKQQQPAMEKKKRVTFEIVNGSVVCADNAHINFQHRHTRALEATLPSLQVENDSAMQKHATMKQTSDIADNSHMQASSAWLHRCSSDTMMTTSQKTLSHACLLSSASNGDNKKANLEHTERLHPPERRVC